VYTRKVNVTMRNGVPAAAKDLMTPPSKAGQLGPNATYPVCNVTRLSEPNCGHEVVTVKPGSTTLLRLINGATLVYMTVCVAGHSVTLVALDGNPVAPRTFRECVDINSGQRWGGAGGGGWEG
jgi:FtsP/CotA-like multicopper oxidase with cupredoxin domain